MQPTSNRKINNKLKPFNLFIFHFIIRMGMERHNSFFECENKRELIVSSVCCKNAAKVDVFSGVPRKKKNEEKIAFTQTHQSIVLVGNLLDFGA